MNIAVLGAEGQLGQCFRAISRHSSVDYHFYNKNTVDITNPFTFGILEDHGIDLVINCAAYTLVDKAETDREQAYRINVEGPKKLGQYAFRNNLPIIHFSTDYIFAPASKPIGESHPIQPINFYGQTKWEGEEAFRDSGATSCIIRTSWLFSEFGHNFVKTMLLLSENRTEISVVNDQTGSPTYARDLAEAIDDALGRFGKNFPSGTFHFANKGPTTWYDFACEILRNRKTIVHPIPTSSYPTPAQRPIYSVLDVSHFEKTFEWEISNWKDALRRCMERI